jgi:hypothetical protein
MKMRALHPEFFTDPAVASLSMPARVLFAGLWCHADDYGRGRWLPKTIEGEVFPRDEVDIEALLAEVLAANLIVRYQIGDEFFQIRSWEKYQKPKYRAKTSIPPCPMDPGQIGDNPGKSAPELARQVLVEIEIDTPPTEGESEGEEKLPAVRWAERWAELRGVTFSRSVKKAWIPKVEEFIAAGGVPSEELLAAAVAGGLESPGGWGFVAGERVAESRRREVHRDCPKCKGKGVLEVYSPGAGMRSVVCGEGVG